MIRSRLRHPSVRPHGFGVRPPSRSAAAVLAALAMLGSACEGATAKIPFWPHAPGADLGRSVDVFSDDGLLPCDEAIALTPLEAAQRLRDQGYEVEWRYETSTGDRTGFSEDVPAPPAGTWLTDVVAHAGGVAFVFVSDRGDPQFTGVAETRCRNESS